MTPRILLLMPMLLLGCSPMPPVSAAMPSEAETKEALAAPGNIRVTGLALASLAAQEALYHTTQALLETAALAHNQAKTVPAPALVEPGRSTVHVIDVAAGTGMVRGVNLGTTATLLTLALRAEPHEGGLRYHVSRIEGKVDGFAVSLPSLTFTYWAAPGPLVNYALEVVTAGRLTTPEAIAFELDTARVAFAYPLATEELGSLTLTAAGSGRRLDSALLFRGGMTWSEGTVSNPAGVATHGVETAARVLRVKPL